MAELRREHLGPGQRRLLRAVGAAAGRGPAPVLVGGAVRDALRRRPRRTAADLDVAVPAGAIALARRVAERVGGSLVVLDEARGAARVVWQDQTLDLADFRAPTLAGDLGLRDYTVNALAVEIRSLLARGRAAVADPTGGLTDLGAGRLRPPHPRVLGDDPLRALRGVRLEAELGMRLTPGATRAIRAVAPRLAEVSAERVRDEMLALLARPAAGAALRRAERLGLLRVVLPEIDAMRATPQPRPHRFDVLEHSLRTVEACDALLARPGALRPHGATLAAHLGETLGGGIDRCQGLRLAALLHDVSKPETRRVIAGQVRFFEHDVRGAARARAIGERLRLPERVVALVERLVRHHLRPMHLEAAGQVTARARYRFYRDLGEDARDLLVLALADAAAVRGQSPLLTWRRAGLIRDLLGGWREQRAAERVPPLVRGEDVMARFAIGPGPEVGRLLRLAREAQALGLVRTRREALDRLWYTARTHA